MSKIIRFILTLALIYGAYTETGVFTALSLFLIFVAIELQGWLTQRALDGGESVAQVAESTPEVLSSSLADPISPHRQ